MTATNDTDVERAIAAFGAPSMAYRTFRPEPPTPHAATQAQGAAVAFPLLAAALPETAIIPMPAPLPPTTVANPVAGAAPPLHSAEIWPLRAARSPLPEPPAPIPASPERVWRGADVRQTAPEQAVRCTPLATVFRMLRAEPIRRDQQPEPRAGLLQDVFRRL